MACNRGVLPMFGQPWWPGLFFALAPARIFQAQQLYTLCQWLTSCIRKALWLVTMTHSTLMQFHVVHIVPRMTTQSCSYIRPRPITVNFPAIRAMADENAQPSSSSNNNNSLRLGNRKKPWFKLLFVILSYFYSHLSGIRHSSNPLVHHGRHFGRTVYAMCNVRLLITNGLLRLKESDGGEVSEESLTFEYVFRLIYSSHGHLFPVL